VENKEQELATLNLGLIILSLACVFPPRSGTGTIVVFDGTGTPEVYGALTRASSVRCAEVGFFGTGANHCRLSFLHLSNTIASVSSLSIS